MLDTDYLMSLKMYGLERKLLHANQLEKLDGCELYYTEQTFSRFSLAVCLACSQCAQDDPTVIRSLKNKRSMTHPVDRHRPVEL